MRPLADNFAQVSSERPEVGEVYRDIIRMSTENYPMVDYHVHLKGGSFIKATKAGGAKFSFGTNNADANLGRLEYSIEMVKQCGLKCQDIFVPKPAGQKPIQVKK